MGLERWRREYNESIVGDLDALMADIEERVASMDRQKEETVEAEEKVRERILQPHNCSKSDELKWRCDSLWLDTGAWLKQGYS